MNTSRIVGIPAVGLVVALVGVAAPSALPNSADATAVSSGQHARGHEHPHGHGHPHGVLPRGPLDILLTNDDGWAAPGINAVYDALVADGHQVTMVAPATNQSGVSARIDFTGQMTVQHPVPGDDDIWSVSTSPAGAVMFGLNHVLADDKPDLVVSGSNVGANTGFDVNFSGTVGATTVAAGMYGIPSIAISTDVARGQEATAAYPETADLLVDILDRGLPRLPRGQFFNINYPVLASDTAAHPPVRYAGTDPASAVALSYTQDPADPDLWTIVPGRSTEPLTPGTDRALLAEGDITVTVLDADRSVPRHEVPSVVRLIDKLNRHLAAAGS